MCQRDKLNICVMLRGAIHVMLLLDSVTDLRSDILSIKINVLVITVLFLYVEKQESSEVSNIRMLPVYYLKSHLFSQKNLQLL